MLWRASERSITHSVRNAVRLAETMGLRTLAFPLIGAGSGSYDAEASETLIIGTLQHLQTTLREVVVVRYCPQRDGR